MRLRFPRSARSLLVFGMKVGGAGLALILNIAITRSIGSHAAGVFFIALSLTTILYAAARFGLGYTTYRYVAEMAASGRGQEVRRVSASVTLMVTAFSLLLGFLVSANAGWITRTFFGSDEGTSVVAILAWTIPIYSIGSILSEILKGLSRPLQYALFENILIKACAIPAVLLLSTNFGVDGTALGILLANCLALLVVIAMAYRALERHPRPNTPLYDVRELLRTTSFFAVVSLSTVLAQWLAPLIVGNLLTPTDAAIFFTAYRTSAVLEFVVISIVSVAGPALVGAYAGGSVAAVVKLARPEALRALAGVSALAVPSLLLAPHIMGLYGADFVRGEDVLRILVVFQIINAPLGIFNAAVIALKREKIMALLAPLSAILAAGLSYTLASIWGLPGAATGVGLSSVLYNLMIYGILLRSGR